MHLCHNIVYYMIFNCKLNGVNIRGKLVRGGAGAAQDLGGGACHVPVRIGQQLSCAVPTQLSEHAIAARHRRHCHPDKSQRSKLSAMADDPANKKEGNEPPKDSTPSDEELPPLWAAAMARQIVEAVKQAGRVSTGTSPGTSGESHTHAHTLLEA